MPNTVPNQKIVHIHRDMPQKGDNNYTVIKNKNFYDAYKDLRKESRGGTATFLWLILAGNKDGFDLAFSPKAIAERSGMPESTCRDLVGILVKKGYLVQKHEGSSVYDFYERPEHAMDPKFKHTTTATAKNQSIPEETEIAENGHRHGEDKPFIF